MCVAGVCEWKCLCVSAGTLERVTGEVAYLRLYDLGEGGSRVWHNQRLVLGLATATQRVQWCPQVTGHSCPCLCLPGRRSSHAHFGQGLVTHPSCWDPVWPFLIELPTASPARGRDSSVCPSSHQLALSKAQTQRHAGRPYSSLTFPRGGTGMHF